MSRCLSSLRTGEHGVSGPRQWVDTDITGLGQHVGTFGAGVPSSLTTGLARTLADG